MSTANQETRKLAAYIKDMGLKEQAAGFLLTISLMLRRMIILI